MKTLTTKHRLPALATATKLMSGWGLKFFDYDNDGNLDLIHRQRPSQRPNRKDLSLSVSLP